VDLGQGDAPPPPAVCSLHESPLHESSPRSTAPTRRGPGISRPCRHVWVAVCERTNRPWCRLCASSGGPKLLGFRQRGEVASVTPCRSGHCHQPPACRSAAPTVTTTDPHGHQREHTIQCRLETLIRLSAHHSPISQLRPLPSHPESKAHPGRFPGQRWRRAEPGCLGR
jgi:hypothetical protein